MDWLAQQKWAEGKPVRGGMPRPLQQEEEDRRGSRLGGVGPSQEDPVPVGVGPTGCTLQDKQDRPRPQVEDRGLEEQMEEQMEALVLSLCLAQGLASHLWHLLLHPKGWGEVILNNMATNES